MVVTDQKIVEWELSKFYWNLYGEKETRVDTEEILKSINGLKKINLDDRMRLEVKITEEEVSITLKQTKNNVAPGLDGFGGSFYKVFRKYLKK